jgi:hypothetical protein
MATAAAGREALLCYFIWQETHHHCELHQNNKALEGWTITFY